MIAAYLLTMARELARVRGYFAARRGVTLYYRLNPRRALDGSSGALKAFHLGPLRRFIWEFAMGGVAGGLGGGGRE